MPKINFDAPYLSADDEPFYQMEPTEKSTIGADGKEVKETVLNKVEITFRRLCRSAMNTQFEGETLTREQQYERGFISYRTQRKKQPIMLSDEQVKTLLECIPKLKISNEMIWAAEMILKGKTRGEDIDEP